MAIITNGSVVEQDDEPFIVWPFTIKEFKFIRDNFKSNNVEKMDQMLDIILMWQWRANDKSAPIVIIDLTKLILQSLVFDRRYVIEKRVEIPNAEQYAQLVYGSAVSRFVNYVNQVCYPVLKKSGHGRSLGKFGNMSVSAKHLNIPGWIVRLRHDFVHTNLPPIAQLRDAAIYCRDWLYENNWEQQIEIAFLPMNAVVTKTPKKFTKVSVSKFTTLLEEFCNLNMNNMKRENRKRLPTVILELKSMLMLDCKNLTNVIGNGFIISTRKQMEDMGFVYENTSFWEIPKSWRVFWKEIVHIIQECGTMGNLMQYMADGVLTSTDLFLQVQYAAWLSHLLDRLKTTGLCIAHYHLISLTEKMLKSKPFYKREKFHDVINLMRPIMPDEQAEQLSIAWDNTDNDMSFNDTTIRLDNVDDTEQNFALVIPNCSLGLIYGQTKESLDLCCTNY